MIDGLQFLALNHELRFEEEAWSELKSIKWKEISILLMFGLFLEKAAGVL